MALTTTFACFLAAAQVTEVFCRLNADLRRPTIATDWKSAEIQPSAKSDSGTDERRHDAMARLSHCGGLACLGEKLDEARIVPTGAFERPAPGPLALTVATETASLAVLPAQDRTLWVSA